MRGFIYSLLKIVGGKKIANNIYLWGILVFPFILMRAYVFYEKEIFTFQPEKIDGYLRFAKKIDGYWQFGIDGTHFFFNWQGMYSNLTYYILIAVLVWSLWKDVNARLKKSLLFITFLAFPYLIQKYFYAASYNIPSTTIFSFVNTMLITWFVSEYRLIINSYGELKKDLLNSISDLAITTDLQLNITDANKKAKQFFNINHQQFSELLATYSSLSLSEIKGILATSTESESSEKELLLDLGEKGQKIFSIKFASLKQGSRILGYTFYANGSY